MLKLTKQPVRLAQVSSESQSETENQAEAQTDLEIQEKEKAKLQIFLEMQNGLKELKHTQEKLHELSHPKRK